MHTLFLRLLTVEPTIAIDLTAESSTVANKTDNTPLMEAVDDLPNSVLTIGNFDGVHLGHQAMIERLKQLSHEKLSHEPQGDKSQRHSDEPNAQKPKPATMVMTFEPQPREYFANLTDNPQSAPPRLTNLAEKQARLAHCGVDVMLVAQFDDNFRSLTAKQFADVLKLLKVQALVLGDDFRFGHDRTGDGAFLAQQGLPVVSLDTVTDGHVPVDDLPSDSDNEVQRISSTRIREALLAGDLDTANRLLGYDYYMVGEVMAGDQIGRTLDFPTANVALGRIKPALHGVFVVDAVMVDASTLPLSNDQANGFAKVASDANQSGIQGNRLHSIMGVASVGTRPSIDGASEWRLEVYFPEFSGNLYGKVLDVQFLHFLHGEKKYASLDALKAGIAQDVEMALAWFKQQGV